MDIREQSFQAEQVELIREVFKYTRRFIGKSFVIQISSEIMEHDRISALLRDVATLHHNGIRVVLIPGATVRINAVLAQFGRESQFVEGRRISTEDSLPLIKMAAFDSANRIMTELSSQQVSSVIGNWVRARALGVVEGVDYQMTGTVEKVSIGQVERLLDDGIIPIIPCIGWNSLGRAYNVSSLELARHVAVGLGAQKLFYIADSFRLPADEAQVHEEGVVIHDGMITRINASGADRLLGHLEPVLSHDEHELLEQAILAASQGVERVHILDGTMDGVVLKEIFSTKGVGTMIHVDPFDAIRPMQEKDIDDVLRLMAPEVEKGRLVPRSREDMLRQLPDFVVYETDGSIRGCGALHRFSNNYGEVAGMAVDPGYNHLGIGNKILRYLIESARSRKFTGIFALTTQAADWFLGMGFSRGEIQDLPEERRQSYNQDRNSRIYRLLV